MLQHCPLVAQRSSAVKDSPDSEGFWECRAEGTLTIKRLSSISGIVDDLEQNKYDLESFHLRVLPLINAKQIT